MVNGGGLRAVASDLASKPVTVWERGHEKSRSGRGVFSLASDFRAIQAFLFGGAQAIAFGAVQGRFGLLGQGGNLVLVTLHKAGLIAIEFAGGGVIAFADNLLLLFRGRFFRRAATNVPLATLVTMTNKRRGK